MYVYTIYGSNLKYFPKFLNKQIPQVTHLKKASIRILHVAPSLIIM